MNHKIWLGIMAALIGLAVWQATHKKRAATPPNEGESTPAVAAELAEASARFKQVLAESEQLLNQGEFMPAALKLHREFPAFETRLAQEGYKEIRPGLTLRDWFATEQARFTEVIRAQFPRLLEAAKTGEFSWRELESFLSHTPFPFINEIQRHYKNEQRQPLAQARAALATNWCLISVISVAGDGAGYELRVREGLRKKWSAPPGLKLVFDPPMSPAEQRAAPKVIAVKIDEKLAEYRFEGKAAQRGSGHVAERAIVTLADNSHGKDRLRSNWDALTLAVTNTAPEQLRFKFANERQTADFSDIAKAQRQALERQLVSALDSLPAFHLAAP